MLGRALEAHGVRADDPFAGLIEVGCCTQGQDILWDINARKNAAEQIFAWLNGAFDRVI